MHLPEIDKYAHIRSPFSRWDPRAKIVSLLILILAIVLTPTIALAAAGLLLAVLLLALTRIPLRFVFIHLRWVLVFVLFFFVVMPLTVPGRTLFRVGPLGASTEGLRLAALIGLRATSAVLLLFPMVATARFDTTLVALQRLGVPGKLVQLIMFSYRYIFVLMDDARKMFIAAAARGAGGRKTPASAKTAAGIVAMLFVRSFERTERIYQAMVSRCYNGKIRSLREFSIHRGDMVKAGITVALALAFITAGLLS